MNALTRAPKAAVIQMRPKLGDVSGNLDRIAAHVKAAAEAGAELVILPENVNTSYFIADRLTELAEPAEGPSARALSALASRHNVHLAAGMALAEAGQYFDAQLLFDDTGTRLATYRKVHLFSAERDWYHPGHTPTVVDTRLGRIAMTICYDLIFPEYIRQLVAMGADLVINSTNWITDDFQRDRCGWSGEMVDGLARVRALENRVWLAMANCIGPENGFDSIGHSCIVSPTGNLIASAGTGEGFALADVAYQSDDLDRWSAFATYREDRRPEIYRSPPET